MTRFLLQAPLEGFFNFRHDTLRHGVLSDCSADHLDDFCSSSFQDRQEDVSEYDD